MRQTGRHASTGMIGRRRPTRTGDRYDQTYCEISRFAEDGRIIELHAFFDTALAERALFANPLATPRLAAAAMPF